MARKDHLVTIQEEDKSSKKAFKRNNAILYQAIQPTIANEINGIGATSKTPDEVKDTKFPILNPIDPIGKNTDGTVNVDLSLENSPFTCIELSDVGATIGAITINLINLVKNFAEKFILDITKDPANVSLPTVTFVPTVENLPAGFPDNDPRYLLEIVARQTPTETRFEVVNRSGGSGTIPAGTVENEHLEWDNVATDWVAVQASTYGATGPFAGTGFLRFANDNIMLSQRNAGNTSDLQFKVSTLDEFDFTNSLDSSVVDLVIRAQQSPQPNAKFVIRQNPDDGASGDITTLTAPQSILFNVNASIMLTIGPTEIDVQVNLDMNDGNVLNITELQGRDDATPFKIVFDQAEDADTFISDDTTTPDRINVTVGGATYFSWIAGTPNVFGVPTGQTAELEMSTNDVVGIGNLVFSVSGSAMAGSATIWADASADLIINVATADVISFRIQDAETMRIEGVEVELNLNTVLRFNATTDATINKTGSNPLIIFSPNGTSLTSQTSGTGQIVRIEGDLGGDELVPAQLIFLGDDSAGTKTEYGIIKSRIKDPTTPTERGNLEFEVNFGGGMTKMLEISGDGTLFGLRVFERLKMEGTNQLVINDSFLEFTDSRTNPGQSGVIRRLFTDSGNLSHLSVVTNTGVVDLETGAGISFPITPTVDDREATWVGSQNIDLSTTTAHVTKFILDQNLTITLSNIPVDETQIEFEIELLQDATGGWTVTFPTEVVETITIATAANALTIVTLRVNDGVNVHAITTLAGTISGGAGQNQTPWLSDIVAAGFDLNDLSNIEFRNTTGAPAAGVRAIWYDDAEGMGFNVITGDHFRYEVQGALKMTLDTTNLLMGVSIAMANFDITGLNDLRFNTTGMDILHSVTGIVIQVPDTTDTVNVDVNGRITQFADGFIDISTNSLDVTERTAPAATANQAKLYSKDVATVTHMFVIDSAGIETDLTIAGGSSFVDNVFEVVDDITATKKITFQLAGGTGTNIFTVNGTADNFTFPNGGGEVIMSQGNQTIGGFKTFTGPTDFDGNVNIGNLATADTLTIVARVDSPIDPSGNKTQDLGVQSFAWANVYTDVVRFPETTGDTTTRIGQTLGNIEYHVKTSDAHLLKANNETLMQVFRTGTNLSKWAFNNINQFIENLATGINIAVPSGDIIGLKVAGTEILGVQGTIVTVDQAFRFRTFNDASRPTPSAAGAGAVFYSNQAGDDFLLYSDGTNWRNVHDNAAT